jgi:glycosyltransferase involved in cell wall biosynthesis
MPEHPRVLQLLGPSTGGIRRVVAALATELEERGWGVVTAGPPGVLEGLARQDAVVPVPGGFDPRSVLAARRALEPVMRQVDIVHAHGLKPGWLAVSVRHRPPVVVSVHNLVLDEATGAAAPVLRLLEGLLPSRADRTIALSDGVAARFDGRSGAHRVRVVPPAAEAPVPRRSAEEVRAELGIRPEERLLVAAARLHPQKDLPTLVSAVDLLRRRTEGVRLVVFGEGPEEANLRRLITDLDLTGIVTLAGTRPSVADELAAADAVVVSSTWESGPLVVFEALQLGRPVVTTPVGAAPEVVLDGETGRIVPVGDTSALARILGEVLADPEGAARMGTAGRRLVAERHGPGAMAAATEAVYREVLG